MRRYEVPSVISSASFVKSVIICRGIVSAQTAKSAAIAMAKRSAIP